MNPLCSCALDTESTEYFFLRCQNYVLFCTVLINELSSIDCKIVSLRPTALLEVIIYGDKMLNPTRTAGGPTRPVACRLIHKFGDFS